MVPRAERYPALRGAARARRRTRALRTAAVLSIALLAHMAFGWAWAWLWASGYVIAQGLETGAAWLFIPDRSGSRRRAGAYLASLSASSTVYAALALPLAWGDVPHGESFAILLLSGGVISVLLESRASRAAFAVMGAPFLACVMAIPAADVARSQDPREWLISIAGVLLLLMVHGVWRSQRQAIVAEAKATAELEADRRRAEAMAASKSSFVAMISHELRTPLSGVIAAGEQLRGAGLEGRAKRAVDVVVDAGRFMHLLLDDLLDLAKIEAGRMRVETLSFDLGELILSLEHHWKTAAEGTGRPLRLTAAFGIPLCVRGDPTRLRQVLNNLLSNALKFTGPEGVTWDVTALEDDGLYWVSFRVTDTGPGLAPEQLEQLFTPFEQTDVSVARTHGGTGLGLALSRELARLMGGDLRVESQLGQGSTFILSVPLARFVAEAAPAQPAGGAAALTGVRVLVVDDHEINRRTVALLLEAAGAEARLAASGADALALLGLEPFDVVLADVNMPGMSGLQLTREIRRRVGLNRSAPVLAFTAGDSAEEQAACRAAGMRGFIAKPLEARALYRAIAEACADRPPAADRVAVA